MRRVRATFCPFCGIAMERRWVGPGPEPQRADILPACVRCGYVETYRPLLVAAALVVRDGQALLVRTHASRDFALVSGYLSEGETIEAAAMREVREEVDLDTSPARFLGTYLVSGSRLPMLIGVVVGHAVTTAVRIDTSEIAEARWFAVDSLPVYPPGSTLARVFADFATQVQTSSPGA
jgi:NAD+ diphosphatase